MLNNQVSISYGALKDLVAGGYAATMLVAVLVGTYQAQEWFKRRGQPKPTTTSAYGRTVVRSSK